MKKKLRWTFDAHRPDLEARRGGVSRSAATAAGNRPVRPTDRSLPAPKWLRTVDGRPLQEEDSDAIASRLPAIYTDLHLFDPSNGPGGWSDPTWRWWRVACRAGHGEKLDFDGDRITNVNLSQGQRKRLADAPPPSLNSAIYCCETSGPPTKTRSSAGSFTASCCPSCGAGQDAGGNG